MAASPTPKPKPVKAPSLAHFTPGLPFAVALSGGADSTAFLELFNARALPHMDKLELLTPRGAEYLEALTEEALGAKRTWSLALADNGHLARVRSPRLARLAAVGLPVVVEDE